MFLLAGSRRPKTSPYVGGSAGRGLLVCLLIAIAGFLPQGSHVLPSQVLPGIPLQQTSPEQADRSTRRTSEPYKGDLSIFEDPDRAEKLQVERVMDVLGMKE